MNKVFSVIFTFLITLILVYISFIVSSNKNFEAPDFKIRESGDFSFDIENGQILSDGDLNLKILNIYDKIISYSGNIEESTIDGTQEFNLEDGFFLVNINSSQKKYLFKSKGFEIQIDGPTSFFINNTKEKVKIFSMDNILKLNFLNTIGENNEVLNTIYLYPNQYITFNPTRNMLIKGADLFRITQLLDLGYFNERVTINGIFNSSFAKYVLKENSEEEKEKIGKMFLYMYYFNKENYTKIEDFKTKRFSKISGESLFLKYTSLFLNNEKKAIFLKNNILQNIQTSLNNNDFSQTNIDNISSNLSELKEIGEKHFEEMQGILKYFSAIYSQIRKEDTDAKIFFKKLLGENTWASETLEIALNSIYFRYNICNRGDFYSEIKDYLLKKEDSISLEEKNYFVYYLNQIITSNIKEYENFENTIEIFKIFEENGRNYYSAQDEKSAILKEKIIKTGIINFYEILNEITKKLEYEYLKLNSLGLFERKASKNLNQKYINILKISSENIFNFYKDYQSNVSLDTEISSNYTKLADKFNQVILALDDYEKYLVKYDKKNDIFSSQTSSTSNNYINLENAKKYLSKFNVKFDDSNIKVMGKKFCNDPSNETYKNETENPECYKIENITLSNGTKISFVLYPEKGNLIQNIEIGGDKERNKGSYNLDAQEEFYNNSGKEFKDFFTDRVLAYSSSTKIEEYEQQDNSSKSGRALTLENTILLGNNGIFTKLKNTLEIGHKNLKIEEKNELYDITITKAIAKYSGNEKEVSIKSALFNSKFIYNQDLEKTYFFNAELYLDSFDNVPIKINGLLKIRELKDIFNSIFEASNNFSTIYYFLVEKDLLTNINDLKLNYNISTKTFSLNTSSISIDFNSEYITKFLENGKKILEKNQKIDILKKLNIK